MTSSVALDITIELIIPDNTAHTVLTALRRLGYERLQEVQRADHIRLVTSHSAPDVARIVQQLSHAEVLFNPNKHRLSYAVAVAARGEGAPESAAVPSRAPFAPAGVNDEYEALVADREDNTSRLMRQLASAFSMPYITGMTRGVLWRLYEDNGPASVERLEWACRVLLSNPVSQTHQVVARPVRAVFGEPVRPAANIRK